jgi:hypothetical protein
MAFEGLKTGNFMETSELFYTISNRKLNGNTMETLRAKPLNLFNHIGNKKGNFQETPSEGKSFLPSPPLGGGKETFPMPPTFN